MRSTLQSCELSARTSRTCWATGPSRASGPRAPRRAAESPDPVPTVPHGAARAAGSPRGHPQKGPGPQRKRQGATQSRFEVTQLLRAAHSVSQALRMVLFSVFFFSSFFPLVFCLFLCLGPVSGQDSLQILSLPQRGSNGKHFVFGRLGCLRVKMI